MNLLKENNAAIKLALIILLGVGVWMAYKYVFAEPLKANDLSATYNGSAEDFKQILQSDFEKWNDKIVQISGTVKDINDEGILLNHDIYCQFEGKIIDVVEHDLITIKGRVIGYDELLEEIKLNQCIFIQ